MSRSMFALLASLVSWAVLGTTVDQVDGIDLDLTEVADSSGYFVYSYSITNPASSTWAVAMVQVDVSATSGTPANLPSTGDFEDVTFGGGEPHAEVGPITPAGWMASLTRAAGLWWFPPSTGFTTDDSIAPGETRGGYGIRSSYLPGTSVVVAEPTVESCCLQVDTTSDFYPSSSSFAVTGYTVVPRYMPEEITIDLLQSQLSTVCTNPLWITNGTLCTEFATLADSAAAEFTGGNLQGAAMALSDLFNRVEAEQQQMHSNAYWLLYLNIRQAYANIAAAGPGALGVVCNPTSTERAAAPVTCTPSAPIPPLGSEFFEVTGWRFIGGPSGEFDITPSGAPGDTWEGLMVVGGTVWMYGTSGGAADSASTTVGVTPRTWAAIPSYTAVEQDQDSLGDMPPIPTFQPDLAHLHPRWHTTVSAEQLWELLVPVPDGPNESLTYFSGPLLQDFIPFYELNDAMTDDQNPWYQNHPIGGNGTTCRQRDLPTIVYDYFEGRMISDGAAMTDAWPQVNFHETHEALVSTDSTSLFAALNDALNTWTLNFYQGLPPHSPPPCTLLY